MNPTLRRIYSLVPSIGAWARAGEPGPLWTSAEAAAIAVQEYVGPRASPLLAQSLHLSPEDLAFLRSEDALHAMFSVVAAIFSQSPVLVDGIFPQEEARVPQ